MGRAREGQSRRLNQVRKVKNRKRRRRRNRRNLSDQALVPVQIPAPVLALVLVQALAVNQRKVRNRKNRRNQRSQNRLVERRMNTH